MHIHWLRPYWFFALIPLLIFIVLLARNKTAHKNWQKVCDPELLPHLMVQLPGLSNRLPLVLTTLAGCLAILALSGPAWTQKAIPFYKHLKPQMIAVSLAPSMMTKDIKPSRLERAKFKIRDYLRLNTEGYTGLLAFSKEPFLVSPLTQDARTIEALLPSLTSHVMPVGGYDISHALKFAVQNFKQSGEAHGNIIVVTDTYASHQDIRTAESIAEQGYTVSVLGMGASHSHEQPLEAKSLKKLAEAGHGHYSLLTIDDSDIRALLPGALTAGNEQTIKNTKTETLFWIDEGWRFVLALIPLALLAFRRGWYEEIVK